MSIYDVKVRDKPKGQIFTASGRYRWFAPGRGVQTYARKARLITVREHIARVCAASLGEVRLSRAEKIL